MGHTKPAFVRKANLRCRRRSWGVLVLVALLLRRVAHAGDVAVIARRLLQRHTKPAFVREAERLNRLRIVRLAKLLGVPAVVLGHLPISGERNANRRAGAARPSPATI